jgi:hypothetical protein
MYRMERKEDHDMLRASGFSEAEIESLSKLRDAYFSAGELQQTYADYRRLEFVRWLVATGRLTDQLV